jgi:Microtubule-associated protein 70
MADTSGRSGIEEGSGGGASGVNAAVLASSMSFKGTSRRRTSPAIRPSLDADEFMNLLHGSDPVKVELNRLENEVRGADAFNLVNGSLSISLWYFE